MTPANPSALFTGQPGHTYGFYSIATDNAGNVQPTPTAAQASTTVKPATQATSLSTISGSGTYGGTATLTATLTADGSGVANEPVAFTFINGTVVTTLGTATTNASGVATLTGVSLAGIGAGTYTGYVGASFAGDANYAGSSGSGNLTVAQAPLTVTANPASKTYGDPDPTFTVSYSGFANWRQRLVARRHLELRHQRAGHRLCPGGHVHDHALGTDIRELQDHLRQRAR